MNQIISALTSNNDTVNLCPAKERNKADIELKCYFHAT